MMQCTNVISEEIVCLKSQLERRRTFEWHVSEDPMLYANQSCLKHNEPLGAESSVKRKSYFAKKQHIYNIIDK